MKGMLANGLSFVTNFGPQLAIIAAIAFSMGSCAGWKATQLWYADTVADLNATLAEVKAEGRVAQAKADAAEKAQTVISTQVGQSVRSAIDESDKRYARTVRNIGDVRLCRDTGGGEVPAAAEGADGGAGAADDDAGDGRVGGDLAGLARRCEIDAKRLEAFQRWYLEQAAVAR